MLVPLLSNRHFYLWDDSSAAFWPYWWRMGDELLHGRPPFLVLGLWQGGNLPAESLLGVFNPVIAADSLVIRLIPDLNVSAVLVKMQWAVVAALGVYLLAREYRAPRWAAALPAAAAPFAGYTLYFDLSTWISGFIAYAWLPHVWWSLRRFVRGRGGPLLPFVFGVLCLTTGNPYGAVGTMVVLFAVLVESLVDRPAGAGPSTAARVRRTVIMGALIGTAGVLTFLPLYASLGVTVRNTGGIANNGFLVPALNHLLASGMPTNLPYITSWKRGAFTFPVTYMAWFVWPLLPWLRWGRLRAAAPALTGLAVVAMVFLLLTLGPSTLGPFRWPIRLLSYLWLPLFVLFAVAVGHGLATSRPRVRWGLTAGILLAQAYLAWASEPAPPTSHLLGLAVWAACTVLLLVGWRHRAQVGAAVGLACTLAVLLFQTHAFPANANVTDWAFPTSVSALQARFADLEGTTFQVAAMPASAGGRTRPGWDHYLLGNMYQPARVESTVAYSGISFVTFAKPFCLNAVGGTCRDAATRLFATEPTTGRSYADLLGVRTLVLQNGYATVPAGTIPAGWSVVRRDGVVTVWRRDRPFMQAAGRVTVVSPSATITSDVAASDRDETITYRGRGVIHLARLNWPGYQVSVNGSPVTATTGAAGLLAVTVPESADGRVTITWDPPGLRAGSAALALAFAGTLAWAWLARRRRRPPARRRGGLSQPTDQAEPVSSPTA